MTTTEIAEELGASQHNVWKVLRDQIGPVPHRNRSVSSRLRHERVMQKIDRAVLDFAIADGWPVREIAATFGVGDRWIYQNFPEVIGRGVKGLGAYHNRLKKRVFEEAA